jgi:N6-adenosine-specific RNA methylase IME4
VSKWKVDQASRLLHTAPDKFEEVHRGDMKLNKAYREIGNKNLEKREREIESPEGLYGIVYADPPWQYEFSATDSRSIEAHYPTMTLEEICNLKVPVKEDAILFLWVTMPKLPEGLKVIDSWGFEYKTGMAWIKDKIGMGYYVRNKHELLLIAKKGSPRVPEPENRPESVFFAPRNNHSEKPDIAYEIIEKMFPNENKIELFARKRRDGWESWGNEVS